MSRISIIPSIAWVARGVARRRPDRVRLSGEEARRLIENDWEDEESEDGEEEETASTSKQIGRKRTVPVKKKKDEKNGQKRKKDDGKFESDTTTNKAEDDETDDEDDREDFELKPDDNLIAMAKCEKDDYTLEIRVFNEAAGDFYVHHDYILKEMPLCMESIHFDPREDDRKGNLLAIGSMEPVVEIWDLNLVDSLEPIVMLGEERAGKDKPKKKKRQKVDQGHQDAVISLSWNTVSDHILASGSADNTILLWDLEEAKSVMGLSFFNDKVQTIEWQPENSSHLLAGTMDGTVVLCECRDAAKKPVAEWTFAEAEIEQVQWDRNSKFKFFVVTNGGQFFACDSRKPGANLYSCSIGDEANESTTICFDQNHIQKDMMVTNDKQTVKIWKEKANKLSLIHEIDGLNVGPLNCLAFNPDSPKILAVGGEKFRLVHLDKVDTVTREFGWQ